MGKLSKKRGLSPIVATILLISLALTMSIIIYIWARGVIGEQCVKFDEPAETICERVNIEAEINEQMVSIRNLGNIPIYGVQIKKKSRGSITNLDNVELGLSPGETGRFNLPSYELSQGDSLLFVPIILTDCGDKISPFNCDNKDGKEIGL